ncbi:lysophospholipid acyltransferase family protein [Sulfurimonas lithotrophica]|uniref:Lysophospholipid acyltransferase family protein n=1 Tax=Sulfurimonas lithotrophica TaxID=2590022 RepID=A0A5P8P320_9BACT|nr:lysophospholipid acyltransferase family protein [Sulfurimonas lithotrophica]QFR50153.1 lysophospholipid acyltransferase family protein [Sulfurimonas lithotrophica]
MIDIQKEIHSKYPNLKNNKLINASLSKFAKTVIHEKTINDFLEEHEHLKGFEFIDAVLEYFNFDFLISDNELENIPTSGRVVIIANHPLGSLDAFVLLKLIGRVRPDVKIVANDFLAEFKSIESLLITINNFKNTQTKESIHKMYSHLEDEGALIIFPAGEVSRMTPVGVRDGRWQKGFLKIATRTNSPILPIYVGAKNSKTFYSVSTLNKKISTLLLSHEMFKQRNKSIKINIGELIPSTNIHPPSLQTAGVIELYRQHIYQLKKGRSLFKTQKAIAHPEDTKQIKKELKNAELLGSTKDGKSIYLYSNTEESIILKEIGRLREVAFRKVGEGANERRDLDKYDKYYKHIVLWDDNDLEIVGSYRIGECKEIIQSFGIDGLYNSTLFEFSGEFLEMLPDAIELGRSFVQPKYWGTRALDYLWYGIGAYLHKNPQIKYMFGPVSLSASYSPMSKDIIFNFFDNYFGDDTNLVKAKSPYNFKTDKTLLRVLNNELVKNDYKQDFKAIKKFLKNFDSSIPVLYKQYAELCEDGGIKFCAYNIDEDFASCVDSFIIVDISKIKDSQRQRYIK